ncbi:hypothetical protein NC651_024064 [Populus alba x Populus x berolinensis]|nr:hypothetical protein NC651_024064 [Populus alba x Populus x berolinensis]
MVRSQMNFKRISLTDIKIDINRVPKKKALIEAMEKADYEKFKKIFHIFKISRGKKRPLPTFNNVLLNMRDDATTKCTDNLHLALLIPRSFIFALDLAVL